MSSSDPNSALSPTEILVPEIPGQHNSSQESDQSLDEESDLVSQSLNIEDFLKNSGNNSLRWRRKLLQKRGTVDSLSYNHWLIFNKQNDRARSDLVFLFFIFKSYFYFAFLSSWCSGEFGRFGDPQQTWYLFTDVIRLKSDPKCDLI